MEDVTKWLKDWRWPDAWLAIFGSALVAVFGVVAADPIQSKLFVLGCVFGLVLFGIGAKKAHYIERDKQLAGNVWVSKWRHGLLQDGLATGGIVLAGSCVFGLLWQN